jgi:LCP family protein required for cell wall assembly
MNSRICTLASFRAAAVATAAAVSLAACTAADAPAERATPTVRPSAGGTSQPSPSPRRGPFELVVEVRDVRADGPNGRIPPRRLRGPAVAVTETITELYSIGFVDPDAWAGGEFPNLGSLFAAGARPTDDRALRSLTLGTAARELEAVKPRRARLDLRFLADAKDRPIVAVANVRFDGIGFSAEGRRPIRHDGRYTLRRANGRWRIVSYDVRARTIGTRTAGTFLPGFPSRDPMFVLVVGSDARPGQSVSATRADSIHIVGVNPRRGRASVLGIPRDSWVPIAGGGSDKINAALARGGPELLVRTVERLTGISLDAYVLTGFQGFTNLVSDIGGIDLTIPFPLYDRWAHARFDKGPVKLTGNKALAFTRARKALRDGDFGRSLNQGRFLVAALATLRDRFTSRGGAALIPWAVAGARHLRTDLTVSDMFELLLAAPAFDPNRVRNEVVPGGVGNVGGRSVVFLGAGAHAKFRDLARDGLLGR